MITVNAGNYGIPLTQFAFGTGAVPLATIYYVGTLFVTYVGAVFVTARGRGVLHGSLARIARMPIVYAAGLGLVVNRAGWVMPEAIVRPVQLVGSAAVPVMLTLLGTELARGDIGAARAALSAALGWRLLAAPMIALGVAALMGLERQTRNVAIVQSSMPTAVGAALMAVELNARPTLVSSVVLVTTLGSLVSLTILLGLLR